jgi:kelch-like protein 2/3
MKSSVYIKVSVFLLSLILFPTIVFANWEAVTPLNTPRDQFTGGMINGKIYVFGGNGDPNGFNLKSTEVYDPATNQWSYVADNEHNGGNGVEELSGAVVNDKLYVFGGYGGYSQGVYGEFNFVEEYNPANNVWTSKAPKPTTTSGARI